MGRCLIIGLLTLLCQRKCNWEEDYGTRVGSRIANLEFEIANLKKIVPHAKVPTLYADSYQIQTLKKSNAIHMQQVDCIEQSINI